MGTTSTNGKRPIDQVDLTQEEDQQPSYKRRDYGPSSSSSNLYNSSSHAERDSWLMPSTQMLCDDADEEVEGDDFNDNEYQQFELYGTLSVKVVGVRFYNGTATMGEFCTVRRDPSNPYDSNAMRIDNVAGAQIGHIGRTFAAKLAPLMDSGEIVVEGQLTGEKGAYDMPIELKLYGSGDPVQQAATQEKFKQLRLPLDHLKQQERERKDAEKRAKEAEKAAKAAAKARSDQARTIMLQEAARRAGNVNQGGSGAESSSSQGFTGPAASQSGPSMEQLLSQTTTFNPRELGAVVDQFGGSEDLLSKMPMAQQPLTIKTQLLPYQKQGLAWLIDRENPVLPAQGSTDTVQLWKRGRWGGCTNIATNYTQPTPRLASGGILADDMGLGKTIQILSLIVADPKNSQQPTLIVSPLSVMSNWAGQIKEHCKPEHELRVLTYYGANKKDHKGADFEQYDVVVTNYETLAIEYLPGGVKSKPQPVPRTKGLLSTKWRRVVLDEGHTIRNSKSKKAQAVFALAGLAESHWALTGTPIVNNLTDLQSLVRFVGLSGGLSSPEIFSACLIRPLKRGQPEAQLLLQALIGTLCLRRMKEMKFVDLKLPKIESHRYGVAFRPEERERYDVVLSQAKGMLQEVKSRNNQASENPTQYSHLLEILLRLRQTCNHWALCKDRITGLMAELEANKQVKLTPENVKLLQGKLQLDIEQQEECPICYEALLGHDPVITSCFHSLGRSCITQAIETQQRCPMCRAELVDTTCLVEPAVEEGAEEERRDLDADAEAPSSKVAALLDILQATTKKDGTKTVVFSQWTSFLNILQKHIQASGLRFCRLDGSMPAAKRDEAITALNTDPGCTIMLASLSVCSVGLNLCAASQVIMADSWWSPAIEDQAVDRVYRLGQTRPVHVWRLVMAESIEDRVLDVQEDKRKLVQTAFGEGAGGKGRREKVARLADIQRLLS